MFSDTKRTVFLSLIFFFNTSLFAQDNCGYWKHQVTDAMRAANYELASNCWQMAYSLCDDYSVSFLKNGKTVYSRLLKTEKSNSSGADITPRMKELTDTLDWIYQTKMKVEDDPSWDESYANFLYIYKKDEKVKMDSFYENSIAELKSKSRTSSLRRYFRNKIIIIREDEEWTLESKDLLFDIYLKLSGHCLDAAKFNEDPDVQFKYFEADAQLDRLMKMVVNDCKQLDTALTFKLQMTQRFPDQQEKLLKNFALIYEEKGCDETETYRELLEGLVDKDPSCSGYMNLGKSYHNSKEYPKAVELFKKALAHGETEEEWNDVHYHIGLAQLGNRNYQTAAQHFKKVSGDHKKDALLFLAEIIASTQCGESTFERQSVYWLANDYIKRAISAGARGVDRDMYLDKAPDWKAVHENNHLEGEILRIECWNETTVIRY